MIREGYKEVKISIDELINLSKGGLKSGDIRKYCSRANLKSLSSWRNIADPADGRKLLIYYSTIPLQTVKKYRLPPVVDLIDQIKYNDAIVRSDQKQLELDLRDNVLKEQITEAVTNEFVKFCPKYDKAFPGKRDKVMLYAKTHAVLVCCMELKPGYSIPELHRAYLNTPSIMQKLKNQIRFGQKLKEFEGGEVNLVHKSKGGKKEYLVKLTSWHVGKVEQYYKDPKKYPHRIIHEMLLEDCMRDKKGFVQYATVAKYLSQPSVKNRLSADRDKSYFRRVVQPSTRRKDPTYAGDLYYCDGSPLQMFYWDADIKAARRLNLFVVMDVKSKKIVGFDFSKTEDVYNWLAAFKMAFTAEMSLPYELMYDHASATKTAEFKALKEAAFLKGCHFNPTAKGEPKQKADVERWFNTFQSGYQRMIDGYIGEGIRSKRDNGRIDTEYLAKVQKVNGYFSYTAIIEIVTKLIAIYNSQPNGKGVVPNLVFKESEKPNASSVTPADLAVLFWKCKKLKVSNSEVKMTIRHNDYFFEVYDHATALTLDTQQVNVYYDENDLAEVHLFSLAGDYICQCRQKVLIPKAKANQTDADVLQIIKQSKHHDSKVRVAKAISNSIAATAMAGHEETFLQTSNPYDMGYKGTANDAETKFMLNYMQQEKNVVFADHYQPLDNIENPLPAKRKTTVQERHAKKNIVPATLQPIKRP